MQNRRRNDLNRPATLRAFWNGARRSLWDLEWLLAGFFRWVMFAALVLAVIGGVGLSLDVIASLYF